MKTKIIQLEPYDDVNSTQDKMSWGNPARILLVWPARGRVLDTQLDLILLRRYAAERGAQLALITRDAEVRHHAGNLGIPVYNHIRKAEQSHWRSKRPSSRQQPSTIKRLSALDWREGDQPDLEGMHQDANPTSPAWIVNPKVRITAFALGVLAVMAIAALLLPSAEIQLSPKIQQQRITIPLTASPEIEVVNLSGELPLRWHSVIVEGRAQIDSSGSIAIPDQYASGEVLFTNLSDRQIRIPAGTTISTTGGTPIRFMTTEDAVLAANVQDITVPIQATTPGSEGNVPAGKIIAIDGELGLNLTVHNPGDTVGGSDRIAPAPNQNDYQNIFDSLFQTLQATAAEEIEAGITRDIFPLSAAPIHSYTIEEVYTPEIPEPADQLHLILQAAFQIPTVSRSELEFLGRSALETNLTPGQTSIPETFTIKL
ncbi:MAG: baseplate J/gp47 family protein, partial [Chloroflexota bacterium]